jgi:Cu-Zn family superoxide dismutase
MGMDIDIIFIAGLVIILVIFLLSYSINIEMNHRQSITNGIAVIKPHYNNGISGVITFTDIEYEDLDLTLCQITVDLQNVPDGEHGFHIHEKGDSSNGCESAGPHYNPTDATHGDLQSGHAGDLGNLTAKDGEIKTKILAPNLTTSEIIGRTIVLHADPDDLGKGGDAESLKTGNAGARIACAIIGIA